MTRTFVDIHVLQTVPPSNVNRDDTGSPKTAVFGGTTRARVSSQAWKRATRKEFDSVLDPSDLGVRSKRIVELVAGRIADHTPGLADEATDLARDVIAATGIQLTETTRKKSSGEDETHEESKYLIFLSNLQIDLLARNAIEIRRDDDPAAALKTFKKASTSLLNLERSIDLALFGRMVADVTDLNVDACAQVAHAISVHEVDNESDYFTAVDDAKERSQDEDAGAGMIGTVEFNSATYYRYATVDIDRLADSLGSVAAAERAIEAFTRAFVTSMPTGKQNTFANRTLPDVVLAQVRDSQPVNLVGAFEEAVVVHRGGPSRLTQAGTLLGERSEAIAQAFGVKPVAQWVAGVGPGHDALIAAVPGVAATDFGTLPGLVATLVAERLADQ